MERDSNSTYSDLNAQALGKRVSKGDREAFREVFALLHKPLVRYAHGITGDENAALDVLQDVFLKFWEKRESLSPHTSLKAMLYTMVRNRSLNAIRDREKRLEKSQESASTGTEANLEQMHAAKELAQKIQAWIEELPERRAEAFRLSRYAGLTHEEIGRIMAVSERTVGTHILLALKHLRVRLDEYKQ